MLICVCSAKGGAGAPVVVTGVASTMASRGDELLLVDLDGDLPAVLGLPEPAVGIGDWLAAGPDVDVGALGRLEVDTGVDGVRLLPLGSVREWPVDRGAALVALLGVDHRTVLVDGGVVGSGGSVAALRDAVLERCASSLLVTRPCYLSLRRAARHGGRVDGVVLVREPGRALDAVDVERVLHAPVVAKVALDPTIARLVDAGVHVLVEKPLVPDVASATRLLDLATRSGRSIVTLTQRPTRPEFRYLQRALSLIDEPYWAEWSYSMAFDSPTSGWRSKWADARGGVLLDMGYHALDVLTRVFGPARVLGASKHFRYPGSREQDLEDLMSASLDFDGGRVGCHLFVARHAREKREVLEVHGTRGIASVDVRAARVSVHAEDGTLLDEYRGPARSADSPAVVLSAHLDVAAHPDRAADHLRHHIEVVRTCEAIYRSAAHTRPVVVGHPHKETTPR